MTPARRWMMAAAVVAIVAARPGAPVRAQTIGQPIRLTSWAVSMANVATGANAVIDIRVDKWSTEEERQKLIATFLEKGEGEGKMAVATQLQFDNKKNTIVFENYSTEPVRLQQVKVVKAG